MRWIADVRDVLDVVTSDSASYLAVREIPGDDASAMFTITTQDRHTGTVVATACGSRQVVEISIGDDRDHYCQPEGATAEEAENLTRFLTGFVEKLTRGGAVAAADASTHG